MATGTRTKSTRIWSRRIVKTFKLTWAFRSPLSMNLVTKTLNSCYGICGLLVMLVTLRTLSKALKSREKSCFNIISFADGARRETLYAFVKEIQKMNEVREIILYQIHKSPTDLSEFSLLQKVRVSLLDISLPKMYSPGPMSSMAMLTPSIKDAIGGTSVLHDCRTLYLSHLVNYTTIRSSNQICDLVYQSTNELILSELNGSGKTCQRFISSENLTAFMLGDDAQAKCSAKYKEKVSYIPDDEKIFTLSDVRNLAVARKYHIGMGIPMNCRNTNNILEIPFLKVLLPSLKTSVTFSESKNIRITCLLGIDRGDSLVNEWRSREFITQRFVNETKGLNVNIAFKIFENSGGKVTYLWNGLYEAAIFSHGCSFFYQVNDDMILLTPGWITEFVQNLERNNLLGVTGPTDQNNKRINTAAFVSFKHYQMFGFLYPEGFVNWYSDDWITFIYDEVGMRYLTSQNISNSETKGRRYEACRDHRLLFEFYMTKYRSNLQNLSVHVRAP